MTTSSNMETARVYLEAAYRDDYETCGALIADGYVWIDHTKSGVAATPAALQQALDDDLGAWSDKQLEVERMMEATDGTVVTQFRTTATHTGPYKSIPATGTRVTSAACNLLRFDENGRIVSEEAYYDDLAIMTALGAVTLRETK